MPNAVPREDDVRFIEYLRDGLTATDIAQREQMSIHTVKSRVQRIYREYGARNRAQLLAAYVDELRQNAIRHDLLNERLGQLLADWLNVHAGDVNGTVTDALQLAFDVRTAPSSRPRQRLRRWLDREPDRVVLLLLTLASLVPLDRSPEHQLRWLLDRQPPRRAPNDGPRANGSGRTDLVTRGAGPEPTGRTPE